MMDNLKKRLDLLLLFLLGCSLALNVYLGTVSRRSQAIQTADLMIGAHLTPFIARTLDGRVETIDLSSNQLPVVLYVFSPDCSWCDKNYRNITHLANQRSKSYKFVGLSLRATGLNEYLNKQPYPFPVYILASAKDVGLVGVGQTPQTIVISQDGKVSHNWVGAYVYNAAEVEKFFGLSLPGIGESPRKSL